MKELFLLFTTLKGLSLTKNIMLGDALENLPLRLIIFYGEGKLPYVYNLMTSPDYK